MSVLVFEDCIVISLKAKLEEPYFKLPVIFPFATYKSKHFDTKGRRTRGGRCMMKHDDPQFVKAVNKIIVHNSDEIEKALDTSAFKFPGVENFAELRENVVKAEKLKVEG